MSLLKEPDRRSRLRSATGEAHVRLDVMVTKAGFMEDRAGYATYLDATWRVRHPIELALSRCGAEKLYAAWPARIIGPAIRADLHDVAAIAPGSEAELPIVAPVYTAAQAFGVLYVLEGSALGARVLARRADALGMSPIFGGRHLALQASMPRAWSTFLSILEAASLDADQEAACAHEAIATFARFECAYDRCSSTKAPASFEGLKPGG